MSELWIATEREAVLSLGANLGDREGNLRRAVRLLAAVDGIRLRAVSGLWESPAWKPDSVGEAPAYLNAIAIVGTTLAPEELLALVREIEAALGRVRTERYGDRTLDIDIVQYEGVEQQTPTLTLPHPQAHRRQFVLQPWLEAQPEAELVGHGPLAEFADFVDGDVWRVGDLEPEAN